MPNNNDNEQEDSRVAAWFAVAKILFATKHSQYAATGHETAITTINHLIAQADKVEMLEATIKRLTAELDEFKATAAGI